MYTTKKHKHSWIVVFTCRFGKVEYCKLCNSYRTFMWDYAKNDWAILAGNFLSPLIVGEPIFLMCKEEEVEHFYEAFVQYSGRRVSKNKIVLLQNSEQLRQVFSLHGTIFLYGSWMELDIVQDPLFTRIMNGWL